VSSREPWARHAWPLVLAADAVTDPGQPDEIGYLFAAF
jgi:hypothetical protein